MSVQITFTAHKVSTLQSFLINAFFFTNFFTQIESAIVTTAGNHSGIAATANAIATNNPDFRDNNHSFQLPLSNADLNNCNHSQVNASTKKITIHIIKIITHNFLLKASKSLCK
ncbi:hypothetical protein J5751_01225 [bacterium]|nr:hypothetical protein [bacterium]